MKSIYFGGRTRKNVLEGSSNLPNTWTAWNQNVHHLLQKLEGSETAIWKYYPSECMVICAVSWVESTSHQERRTPNVAALIMSAQTARRFDPWMIAAAHQFLRTLSSENIRDFLRDPPFSEDELLEALGVYLEKNVRVALDASLQKNLLAAAAHCFFSSKCFCMIPTADMNVTPYAMLDALPTVLQHELSFTVPLGVRNGVPASVEDLNFVSPDRFATFQINNFSSFPVSKKLVVTTAPLPLESLNPKARLLADHLIHRPELDRCASMEELVRTLSDLAKDEVPPEKLRQNKGDRRKEKKHRSPAKGLLPALICLCSFTLFLVLRISLLFIPDPFQVSVTIQGSSLLSDALLTAAVWTVCSLFHLHKQSGSYES